MRKVTLVLLVVAFAGWGSGCATNSGQSTRLASLPSIPGAVEYKVVEPYSRGEIFVYEAGQSNAVSILFIHGAGDEASSIWKDVIPQVAATHHVVIFDLPGFGRSPGQNILYSPSFYARITQWIADRCIRTRPFIVVGHSLGGAVALSFAATCPDNLQRLVLVDVSGVIHRSVFTQHILKGIEEPHQGPIIKPSKLNGEFLAGIVAALEFPTTSTKIQEVLESPDLRRKILNANPQRIAGLALADFDFSGLIHRIESPAVIVWGEKDPIAPLRTGKMLHHLLKETQLNIVPGAGHNIISGNPPLFNKLLKKSLATHAWQAPWKPPTQTNRTVRLFRQRDVVLSGHYESIEIVLCDNIRIENVETRYLKVEHSDQVTIENGRIHGDAHALHAHGSSVSLTGVQLSGETAIVTDGSFLDLAGVKLTGREAAVRAISGSELLFSVSEIESPLRHAYLHGFYEVTEKEPL